MRQARADTKVNAGYHGAHPTVQELTFRLEAARQAERIACEKYIKLRGKVLAWAESRTLENEGAHLHALLREVGRWPEQDSRTDVEREMDGLRFVGAHRRGR